jgi:hypothetical protein
MSDTDPTKYLHLMRRFALLEDELHRTRTDMEDPQSLDRADGEGVVLRPDGVSDFDALHDRRRHREVQLLAFDLLELDGEDLRADALEGRKAGLAKLSCAARRQAFSSSNTLRRRGVWCLRTRVRLAWRASYLSAATRPIGTVAAAVGSKLRTRGARRRGGCGRIGFDRGVRCAPTADICARSDDCDLRA